MHLSRLLIHVVAHTARGPQSEPVIDDRVRELAYLG